MGRVLRYMLETNTASYLIKGHPPAVQEYLRQIPIGSVCISSVVQAELLFGVTRKPKAKGLQMAVNEFLLWVDIVPWDSRAAEEYARLRAFCEKKGSILGSMDLLIAAHAISLGAILITNDKAFYNIKHKVLELANWAN